MNITNKLGKNFYIEAKRKIELVHKGMARNGRKYKIIQFLIRCPICSKKRWISKHNLIFRQKSSLCLSCSAKNNVKRMNLIRIVKRGKDCYNWKGGTIVSGYRVLVIHNDNPYYCMADKWGKIREHRLIMAKHLGRPLKRYEIVHHKNGNKLDNRIVNLRLLKSKINHLESMIYQSEVKRLNEEILKLRTELCLLKSQK